MSFECIKTDSELFFICTDHGDLQVRAELLLRDSKVPFQRERKRPGMKKISLITIRCKMCGRFEEKQISGLSE